MVFNNTNDGSAFNPRMANFLLQLVLFNSRFVDHNGQAIGCILGRKRTSQLRRHAHYFKIVQIYGNQAQVLHALAIIFAANYLHGLYARIIVYPANRSHTIYFGKPLLKLRKIFPALFIPDLKHHYMVFVETYILVFDVVNLLPDDNERHHKNRSHNKLYRNQRFAHPLASHAPRQIAL